MTTSPLASIGTSLATVGAIIAERLRHEGANEQPPFEFFDGGIELEAQRLRAQGQDQLADALVALRNEYGA